MICNGCGTKIDDHVRICPFCGEKNETSVPEVDARRPESRLPENPYPPRTRSRTSTRDQGTPPSRRGSWLDTDPELDNLYAELRSEEPESHSPDSLPLEEPTHDIHLDDLMDLAEEPAQTPTRPRSQADTNSDVRRPSSIQSSQHARETKPELIFEDDLGPTQDADRETDDVQITPSFDDDFGPQVTPRRKEKSAQKSRKPALVLDRESRIKKKHPKKKLILNLSLLVLVVVAGALSYTLFRKKSETQTELTPSQGAQQTATTDSEQVPEGNFSAIIEARQNQRASQVFNLCSSSEGKVPAIEDYRLYYYVEAAATLKRLDDCIAAAKHLITTYPDSRWTAQTSALLGYAYQNQGEWLEAAQAFVQAEEFAAIERKRAVDWRLTCTRADDCVCSTCWDQRIAAYMLQRAKSMEHAGNKHAAAGVYQHCWLSFPLTESAEEAGISLRLLANEGIKPPVPTKKLVVSRAESLLAAKRPATIESELGILQGEPEVDLLLARAKIAQKKGPQVSDKLAELAADSRFPDVAARATFELTLLKLAAGQYTQAESTLEPLLRRDAKNLFALQAMKMLGINAQVNNREADALRWYTRLTEIAPETEEARYALWQMAWLYYGAARWERAADLFKDLNAKATLDSGYHAAAGYWAGKCHQKLGNMTDSQNLLLKTYQDHPLTYYGKLAAAALMQSGKSVGVAGSVSFPSLSDPLANQQTPQEARISALVTNGLVEDAAREMQRFDREKTQEPAWLYRVAELYAQAGNYFAAAELLDKYFADYVEGRGRDVPHAFWQIYYPQAYWNLIKSEAQNAGIDPYLVISMTRRESHFRSSVISSARAVGLMQLKVETAQEIARKLGLSVSSETALEDPSLNVKLGCAYLKYLMTKFDGDVTATVAAYNMGETRIMKWYREYKSSETDERIDLLPYSETRVFVKNVLQDLQRYKELYGSGT